MALPKPATLVLVGIGAGVAALAFRRRGRAATPFAGATPRLTALGLYRAPHASRRWAWTTAVLVKADRP